MRRGSIRAPAPDIIPRLARARGSRRRPDTPRPETRFMWLRPFDRFVRPPESVYRDPEREFLDGCHTYAEYNYLRPGLIGRVKTAHFEKALEIAEPWIGATGAVDFGCADGFFLPSLARHFPRVLAVERVPHFVEVARSVVEAAELDGVQVWCNAEAGDSALAGRTRGQGFGLAFCLEVLEHVGEPGDLWAPKVALVHELLAALDPPARVIASVPVMVGPAFLAQRAALAATGGYRESLSWSELLRAGLLADTAPLEPRWDGGHLGFNHRRLERELVSAGLEIETRAHLGFQVVYGIRSA